MYRIGETIPLIYAVWDSTNNLLLAGQTADLKLDIYDESDATIASYFLDAAEILEYEGSGVYYVNANVFDAPGVYKAIWNCQIEGAQGYYVDLIKIHTRDIDNVDNRLANDSTGLGTLENKINDVQTDLDNPAQFKADVSTLASQASVDGVAGQLLDDTTGLYQIHIEASDNPDVSVDLSPVIQRLDSDTTGLHALKTFLQDLHYHTFNKVVLTRLSSTSYRMEIYDPTGAVIVRTINLTKAGSVETRE